MVLDTMHILNINNKRPKEESMTKMSHINPKIDLWVAEEFAEFQRYRDQARRNPSNSKPQLNNIFNNSSNRN